MAVLVIGGGLVGSHIARVLVERGERPVVMDRAPQREAIAEIVDLSRLELVEADVLKPLSLTQVLRQHRVTKAIHTAANPLLTLGAQREPYAAIELNVMGTANVLEAARIHGLERVVVASSNVLNHFLSAAAGDPDPRAPMAEEAFPRPTTFYAATKQAIESIGLNYARWSGVDFAAVRYGAVAGPWSGRGGGGPSNVFREAITQALAGGEAVIPEGALEWVYVKDAALGTVQALEAASLASRVFNLTMGSVSGPQDLAAAIAAAIPGARTRIATPAAQSASLPNMVRASDLRLARDVLGYAPRYDMAAAVRDMVLWLKSREIGR